MGRDVLKSVSNDAGFPVSQILSAIAGYVFAFLIGELGGMSELDIIVFGLIVAVCVWLSYEAAAFHRATRESQAAARQMEAALDRFSTRSLTVDHRIETYTVHDGRVSHRSTITLTNNTSEVCDQFRYGICRESSMDYGRFETSINGHRLSNVPNSEFDITRNIRESLLEKSIDCRYLYELYIPIHLLPHQTCTVEVVSKGSASMDSLLRCLEDSASVRVHLPTRIMEIVFELDDDMAKRYQIEARRCIATTPTEVYDHSGNRMNIYESEVCERNRPSSDGRTVRWSVMEPVVGFSYKLFLMMHRSEGGTS